MGRLAVFLIFQLVFALITAPLIVFYGPFQHVKKTIVGSSWATLNHRWIAQTFLSDAEIEKLIGANYAINPFSDGGASGDLPIIIDHNQNVEVYNVGGPTFSGKMLVVADPTRVVVGSSSLMPREGQTVSAIAERMNAVAAINAGGFSDEGMTGTGGAPDGFIISGGKLVYDSYENSEKIHSFVGIDSGGILRVGVESISKLLSDKVNEAISFGPPLVVNGEPTITNGDGGWGIAPRTAIGQTSKGEILLLTIDGRSLASIGATLKDVQDLMISYGAVNACNLDGGSSTSMYYKGKIINRPSDGLGERLVPSAFVVLPVK
jgi:exopolysaccharide biosynthesis protein